MTDQAKSGVPGQVLLGTAGDAPAPSESSESTPASAPKTGAARRRSLRVHLEMPVFVYGHGPNDETFFEENKTVSVSACGALITLSAEVSRGQKLILGNPKTEQHVECRVIYVEVAQDGTAEVAIEFATPFEKFWGIAFPPDDWDPAGRKRPQPQR